MPHTRPAGTGPIVCFVVGTTVLMMGGAATLVRNDQTQASTQSTATKNEPPDNGDYAHAPDPARSVTAIFYRPKYGSGVKVYHWRHDCPAVPMQLRRPHAPSGQLTASQAAAAGYRPCGYCATLDDSKTGAVKRMLDAGQ